MEWLRYGIYNKERSTAVDASSDHADLYSLIHSIFKENAVRSYKMYRKTELQSVLGIRVNTYATAFFVLGA